MGFKCKNVSNLFLPSKTLFCSPWKLSLWLITSSTWRIGLMSNVPSTDNCATLWGPWSGTCSWLPRHASTERVMTWRYMGLGLNGLNRPFGPIPKVVLNSSVLYQSFESQSAFVIIAFKLLCVKVISYVSVVYIEENLA